MSTLWPSRMRSRALLPCPTSLRFRICAALRLARPISRRWLHVTGKAHLQYRRFRAILVLAPTPGVPTVAFWMAVAGPKLAVLLHKGCRQRALRRSRSPGNRCIAHLHDFNLGRPQRIRSMVGKTRLVRSMDRRELVSEPSPSNPGALPKGSGMAGSILRPRGAGTYLSLARLVSGPYDGVLVHRCCGTDAQSPFPDMNVH